MLQRGTLQFLKEISGTGESQQSHHPLWLNIHATEKLCDQCPCSLLVNWKRLSCQNSARWKQAHNCCKFRVLSKWTNSPTGGHLLCACTSHKLNISMKFSPVSTCSHYFNFAQLWKLHNGSNKHIRKLFYFPAMQYMLSGCALFYFLYLTDFHNCKM